MKTLMPPLLTLVMACATSDPPPAQTVPAAEIGLDTIATGLDVPWAMAFAPDGRIFVTERPGRIRVIENGKLLPDPWATLSVDAGGEAGLMGLALPPDFATSHQVFVVGTFRDRESLVNRVMRFTERDAAGVDPTVILDNIPSNTLHAGDAVAFGPDGMLYVATGDARTPTHAQQDGSLAGKILRLTRDGRIPADNPDPKSMIFARGFRNVQGLAWHADQLFATEHGPSGFGNELGRRDHDELNFVIKDGNYGWPVVSGWGSPGSLRSPLTVWSPAIAPSGLAIYYGTEFPEWNGSLFVGALRGEQLRRVTVGRIAADAGWLTTGQEALFEGSHGRIRAVVYAPDGHLYFSVTNRDGRGIVRPNDDKIFRIVRKR